MIGEVIKRKKYYNELGKHKNITLKKIDVLKHNEIPNTYFIHTIYKIGKGGIYKTKEILETYDNEKGWQEVDKDMTHLEYGAFLKDLKPTEI